MKRRGVRLTLLAGFLVVVAGSGYALWTLGTRAASTREARAAFDAQADRAAASLIDVRTGLEGYVAAGQRVEFWTPRVTAAIESFGSAADGMQRLAPGAEPSAAMESATDLTQLDARVRDLIGSDQTLVASDLVFSDGLEMLRAAGAHVIAARTARDAAAAAEIGDLTRRQAFIAAAAAGVALLVALLLLPAGAAAEAQAPAVGLQLSAPPAPAESDDELTAALDAGLAGSPPGPATREPAAAPAVDLAATADLCAELSRLADPAALTGLLARAADLLGAKGLTIWVADPTGSVLYPTAAHGYSPQVLARIGSLRKDDDNATSLAFRTASVQTVKGGGAGAGAIVVPLLAVSGCVGAMAAELAGDRAGNAAVAAVARIVAAQIATLVPAAPGAASAEPPAAQASNG